MSLEGKPRHVVGVKEMQNYKKKLEQNLLQKKNRLNLVRWER